MGRETLSLGIFYYGLYTLKGFFSYRVMINSGLAGIYSNLKERCTVDFSNISWRFCP